MVYRGIEEATHSDKRDSNNGSKKKSLECALFGICVLATGIGMYHADKELFSRAVSIGTIGVGAFVVLGDYVLDICHKIPYKKFYKSNRIV